MDLAGEHGEAVLVDAVGNLIGGGEGNGDTLLDIWCKTPFVKGINKVPIGVADADPIEDADEFVVGLAVDVV